MEKKEGSSIRVLRVEKEIHQIIAGQLFSLSGELPGIVSVARVVVSKDLRTAKVLVAMMTASKEEKREGLKLLKANAYRFQAEVNRQLHLRYCPKIHFLVDETLEHVLKVETILRNISEERKAREAVVGQQE